MKIKTNLWFKEYQLQLRDVWIEPLEGVVCNTIDRVHQQRY